MDARQRSTSLKRRFNASSIGVARVKAKSPHNAKRKIVVKFFPAFLKAKRSARRLEFLSATKIRDRRITPKWQRNFGRRMRTSPTKRNMEFEIGRAGDARLRAKPSGASQRPRSREKFCARYIRKSTSSLTLRKSTNSRRRSTSRR